MKLHIQILFLSIIIFSIANFANAQSGAVEGVVTDDETSEPLLGVNVGLQDTDIGKATDKDGQFVFREVPPGTYTLIASFVGYATVEEEITVNEGEVSRVRISLAKETLQGGTIRVVSERSYRNEISSTALRTSTLIIETAVSVSTITSALIEEQAAFTKKDIYRNVAGLNEFAFNNDVTLRGFRVSSPTLYNGLRGNPYGSFHLDPKLTNVDRIDVLKGPASVTFGSLPPGGLINMVTMKPQSFESREISFRAGSFDLYNIRANITGPLTSDQKLLYRIDAEFEDSGSFRDNQQSDFINATGALTWKPNQTVSLTAEGGVFDETLGGQRERGIPFFNNDVFFVPISFTSHEATDFFKNQVYYGEAHFDYLANDFLRLNASVRYFKNNSQEEYHEPRGIQEDATDFDNDGNTSELIMVRNFRSADREREGFSLNANAIWDVNTGDIKHKILIGGDVLIEETTAPRFQRSLSELLGGDVPVIEVFSPAYNPGLSDTYRLGSFQPDGFRLNTIRRFGSENTRLGVYVQDQISVGKLRLSGALRFESFNDDELFGGEEFDDNQFTFRGGALYKVFDNWSLYGSYSESYEPQSVGSQDLNIGGPFDPEESWQIEFGTKFSLFQENLFATVAGYFITKENVLATSPDNPDLLEALGEVESNGVELEIVGNVTGRFRVSGNYAYNDIEVTKDSNPDLVGQTFPNAPKNQAGLWASYSFLQGDLTIAGGPTFVSERETFSSPPNLPSYTVLDFATTYRFEAFTFRLKVDNLTDEQYITGGFGGRNGGLPGAPRNIIAGITYSF